MKRTVALEYSLAEGWLSPWLDGLRTGKAVASTCAACGDAQFPPLRCCPNCGAPCDGWKTLEGGATVMFRTTGTDGDFALARFDGAGGGAIARCDALPPGALRAELAPASGADEPPVLSLVPEARR